jgi:hypothetical protein
MKGISHFLSAKLKAGVLQLTLGIGLVICILCAAMIMLVYSTRLLTLKEDLDKRLTSNAFSGVQYGMAVRDQLGLGDSITVDLFGDATDSATIYRKPWGLFEVIVANVNSGQHTRTKSAFVTAKPDEIGMSALLMPESNSPIYMVGDAFITGDAFVPDRKFVSGFLAGKDYERKTFIEGQAMRAPEKMPSLDTTLLAAVTSFAAGSATPYTFTEITSLPHKPVSFNSRTQLLHRSEGITLSDSVNGNIIIRSDVSITITERATLKNIVLVAPEIRIEDGFVGSVQCFATKFIHIGAESVLEYPSALTLLPSHNDSTIVIDEHSRVTGIVVIPGMNTQTQGASIFHLKKGAVLHGQAYINGRSDIRGSVMGHITTRQFVVSSKDSEYADYLLDGKLNAKERGVELPGSLLWAHTRQMVVAQWVQ